MALGNWTYQKWNAQGARRPGRTFYTTAAPRVGVGIFKNYLDVEDPLAWSQAQLRFTRPIVRRIERGGQTYRVDHRNLRLQIYRGPQDGLYVAVWTFTPTLRGAFLAGVEAFDETGAQVNLLPSSVEWFSRKLTRDLGVKLPSVIFGYKSVVLR
jgi:hypothetical protein